MRHTRSSAQTRAFRLGFRDGFNSKPRRLVLHQEEYNRGYASGVRRKAVDVH